MQLIVADPLTVALALGLWLAPPEPPPPSSPGEDDLIGELVVEATEGEASRARRLARIEIRTDEGADAQTEAVVSIVANDLELSGVFDVFRTPDPERFTDYTVVVRRGDPSRGSESWTADLTKRGTPQSIGVDGSDDAELRHTAHRLTDAIFETATGVASHFSGRLAIVGRDRGSRAVYTADVDGHDVVAVSPKSHLIAAIAFSPEGRLHWSASVEGGAYRLYNESVATPIDIGIPGSIYGLAFRLDKFAVSVAREAQIELWEGSSAFTDLRKRSPGPIAQSPTYVSAFQLATIEEKAGVPRVRFAGRSVSDRRRPAASLTYCDVAGDPQLVWVEHTRRSSFVYRLPTRRAKEAPTQVLAVRGELSGIACSPDGRTLAASYVGKRLAGDGVYLMGLVRARPIRIDKQRASAVQWAPTRGPAQD